MGTIQFVQEEKEEKGFVQNIRKRGNVMNF